MYRNNVILRIISSFSLVISCLRFLLCNLLPPRDHRPTLPLQACSVIRFSRLRFVLPSLSSLVHVHKHLCLIPYFISLCFSTSPLFPQPFMLREDGASGICFSSCDYWHRCFLSYSLCPSFSLSVLCC